MSAKFRAATGALVHALVLVTVLAACSPLYVPPVPTTLPPLGERTRVREIVLVVRDDRTVAVSMNVDEIERPGWLAVQWFGPAGPARASEATWVDDADLPLAVTFVLPERVDAATVGRWRAVVTFGDDVVGQREWVVEAD